MLLVFAVAAAATAGAVWWRLARARGDALPQGWTATTLVVAGDGVAGWRDGDAGRARFADPFDVAVAPDGTLYVSDAGASQRIRVIAGSGRVSTLAGGQPGFADGPGATARFDTPSGIALDSRGILYVADTGNNAIRRVSPDGHVSTIAGDGTPGYREGAGHQAQFNGPVDVAVDGSGRVLVADTYNDRIRAIAPDGTVSTIAGAGHPGYLDGGGLEAAFDTPAGIAAASDGTLLIADTGNGLVRQIHPDGTVSTPAQTIPDGLVRPTGIAAGSAGEIYVTDDRGRIIEIARGVARTLAGSAPGFADGDGAASRFRRPSSVVLVEPGHLMVADAGNALVRRVAAPSRIRVRVPASPFVAPQFDADAFGLRPLLWPIPPMEGPHEIAGTLGEARGSEGSERFHAGIDIRAPDGTPVVSVRDEVVVNPVASGEIGTLNEWLRIGALAYVHVRAGRTRDGTVSDPRRFVATHDDTGQIVRMRVKRGARFATGERIASANAFNHVHLNVGWPGEEHNPLRFRLPHFDDTRPPTIPRGGVRLYDEAGQPLRKRARGRVLVSGRVRVVVDAWDQADHNRPNRRLGLYAVGYQVLNRDASPAPGFETARETIRFDQLTIAPDAARVVYADGSGIPHYGRRMTRFLYIATNTFRDGAVREGYWDTTSLPPGDYIVRALVTDIRGNMALANRDLPITVGRGW
jgi:DNA-binding beta-propeller fold protein YncE